MATTNDLLTQAIKETKHLHCSEVFLVRNLFKGYAWNRISRKDRLLLGTLFLNYVHTVGTHLEPTGNLLMDSKNIKSKSFDEFIMTIFQEGGLSV